MNSDTIKFYGGGTGRNAIPTLSLAATTETAFKVNTDSGSVTAFLTVPTGTEVLGANAPFDPNANPAITMPGGGRQWGRVPGSNRPYFVSTSFDSGRPFLVRLAGTGVAGANAGQTALVNLYCGTSSTLGSDTIIATSGAALAMAAGGSFNFIIEATLVWDSVTQLLGGTFWASMNYTSKAASQNTAQVALSNYAAPTTVAGLSFLASAKFGNAAASTCSVSEFSLEQR